MGNRLGAPQSVAILARFRDLDSPYCEVSEHNEKVQQLSACVDFGMRAIETYRRWLTRHAKPLPDSHKFYIDISSRSPLILHHWQPAIGEVVRDWRAEHKVDFPWTIMLRGNDETDLFLYRLHYELCVTTVPVDTGHFAMVNNPDARVRLL